MVYPWNRQKLRRFQIVISSTDEQWYIGKLVSAIIEDGLNHQKLTQIVFALIVI